MSIILDSSTSATRVTPTQCSRRSTSANPSGTRCSSTRRRTRGQRRPFSHVWQICFTGIQFFIKIPHLLSKILPRIYFVLLRFLIVNSRIYTKKRLLKCIQDALIKFVKHFMHSWREQKSASENITHSRLAPSILLIRWFSLTPGCPKIIMNLSLNSSWILVPNHYKSKP